MSRPIRISRGLLGGVSIAAFASWAFIEVADDVVEGDAVQFDRAVLLALHSGTDGVDRLGPEWLEATARDVTSLGSAPVLALLVAAVALFLLLAGRRWDALFVPLAASGGAVASVVLKAAFGRALPDLVVHGDQVTSASFPTGHAMLAAVVYLTLGALLSRILGSPAQRFYVMAVAMFLTVLVGLSRVYLGVHWPTDVLAGWAAGIAWATGCWAAAQCLRGPST